jgi:CRISPR-associated endonuclease Csn1
VEEELRALAAAAVKQLPALAPHTEDLLYGPGQAAYASYNNPEARTLFEHRTGTPLIRGKATDWQGVLSQKIPTFDNRALSSCALIPRFHSAKCEPKTLPDGTLVPDSLLPAEVTFLMKLKNFRFALAKGATAGFTVVQIREIFEDRVREATVKKDAEAYRLTKTQLNKIIERCGGVSLLPNQTEVEAPRLSGRSRFSKPALKLIRTLVLSGKSPEELHAEALAEVGANTNPLSGLIGSDLQFLRNIKSSGGSAATWENFYLPDESLSFVENSGVSSSAKIRSLIGRQNNPVVRHRLETFWKLLRELEAKHGTPKHIAIEFVREDFMGDKAKIELARFQKERREARAEARKEAGPGKDGLRYQLLKDQGFVCMYCESPLGLVDLPNCHLDHIVPDKMGGPGAYWNFALCCSSCNAAKGKRTPWQWFHEDHRAGWDAYVARVRARTFQLRNKKVRLLTDEDAPTQVQRYQTLAETAWIARLAQMLVCLHFGWPRNFAGGPRHVVVLPGGLTARVRRKYGLNALLGQDIAALELKLKGDADAKVEAEIDKKCRADKRHHALDAMVLSFLPQWTSDPTKQINLKLPEGINLSSFEYVLKDVEPTFIAMKKPVLRDTIYAARKVKGTSIAASRFEISKLGYGTQTPDGKLKDFSPKRLKKQSQEILDSFISMAIGEFADQNPTADEWAAFASQLKSSPNGPLVRKAMRLSNKPNLSNYKDLSKDGNGAWRTSKEGHRGQWVYVTAKGEPKVVPVLVFESPRIIKKEVQTRLDFAEFIGFFESLCCIEIAKEVEHSSKKIPPGRYTLRTLQSDGRASFDSAGGQPFDDIPLKKLLPCGFARI